MEYRTLVQKIIDNFQTDFPLVNMPYKKMAEQLEVDEQEIIETLNQMKKDDLLSRVGPIFKTHSLGHSILAAAEVPFDKIDETAKYINSFVEVNHNYERENKINMWFVITATNVVRVEEVCSLIEKKCDLFVLRFPMVKPYKIDLSVKEKINWELL